MLIVLIPAYNEEKNISKLVKRSKRYVDKVLVVDDGSSDNTSKQAKQGGAIVERLGRNVGKAKAIVQGIKAAKKFNPDIIVLMDGDGQHFPEDIPRLIKPIKQGKADIVFGYRKMMDKHFYSILPGLVADIIFHCKDVLGGFKAIRYKDLLKLNLSRSDGYLFELAINDEARKNKLRRSYVNIKTVCPEPPNISWLEGVKYLFKYLSKKK